MSLKASLPNFENFKQQFQIAFASCLTDKSIEILDKVIDDLLSSDNICYTQPYVDSVWLSKMDGIKGLCNGIIASFYYHPTYNHTSITKGYNGKKTSVAKAGEWAISYQTKARWGNKTGYQTDIPDRVAEKMNNKNNDHYGIFCNVDDGMMRKVVNGHFVCNFMQ